MMQFDDTILANLHARVNAGNQTAIYRTNLIEADDIGKYGPAKPLAPGTHYFYIPLLASIFGNFGGLFVQDMPKRFRLEVITPSTIIAEGAGSISSEISFGVEGHLLNETDKAIYRHRHALSAWSCNFLEPVRTSKTQVLTVGSSDNWISLDNVQGAVSHQMVVVRPAGQTNVGNGRMRWLNIGDSADARIELVDANNTTITGSIPTQLLRQHLSPDHFSNDWVDAKPCYYLAYCQSIPLALSGLIDGGRYFKPNHTDRIRLHLPPAAVQEVQTVTFSATPQAAGFYRLRFRGEETAELAGNASPADMKAAFDALRGVKGLNLSATFSAAASAGTSVAVTFTDPEGWLDGDLISFVAADGFGASCSTARTTPGVHGLPGTGTYEITVYSFMYKTATFNGQQLISRPAAIPEPQGHQ